MKYIKSVWPFTVFLIVFFIVMFVPCLIFIFIPLERRYPFIRGMWRVASTLILRIGFFSKLVHINKSGQKRKTLKGLFIVNHQSAIDIPLLCTQHQVMPLMKKEILYYPFFGLVAMVSGSIVVDRKDRNSRKKALFQSQKRLKRDFPVQVYPEGTRSRAGAPLPFEKIHRVLLDFSYRENVPVTPISLYGSNQILNGGNIQFGKTLGVLTQKTVYPEDFKDEESFSSHCWNLVREGFDELQKTLS